MRNLIYIESPFQLLQAYEVIHNNSDKIYKIIIRLSKKKINNQQLYNLKKLFNFEDNTRLISDHGKIGVPFIALRLMVSSYFYENLYIGDENSRVFRIIRCFIKSNKIIFLDDGVSVLNSKYKGNYKRFTIFSTNNFKQNNKFSNIRKKYIGKSEYQSGNIIIGQPFVEENCSERSVYEKYLYRVLEDSSNSIIYVPHRTECKKNTQQYKKKFGFEILELRYPIELIEYETGIRPSCLYGSISTAFFSLSILYEGIPVVYYKFKEKNILRLSKEMNRISEYSKKIKNIRIIHEE